MSRLISSRVALGFSIAGAIVAAAGGVTYAVLRRREGGGLGYAASRSRRGKNLGPVVKRVTDPKSGMTMTHIRKKHMSVQDRVAIIQDLVWESINGPDMPALRKLALDITKDCPERDGVCEARAIYLYVKDNLRYTGDIAPIKLGSKGPVEAIDLNTSARRALEMGGEDCDGHAIVTSTLNALAGLQPRVRVTAPKKDAEYSHIYAMAGVNSKLAPKDWVAQDTTLPGKNWFNKQVPYGKHLDFPGAQKGFIDFPA